MADLVITDANVAVESEGARVQAVTFGELVDEGEPVYLSRTDSKYYKCDATVDADTARCRGICLQGAAADAIGLIVTGGSMDLGATLTVDTLYVVSPNAAGGIAPFADLGTGDFISILGIAIATDEISLQFWNTGNTHA